MAVGDIQHQQIGAGIQKHSGPLDLAGCDAGGSPHPQPPVPVARRVGILLRLGHICCSDQPHDSAAFIQHRELLQPVFVEEGLGFLM